MNLGSFRRRASPGGYFLGEFAGLHKADGGDDARRRCLADRFLASAGASAAVEYVVVLTVVGAVVLAGVSLLGTTVKQAADHVTLAAAVDGRAIAVGTRVGASPATSSVEAATHAPQGAAFGRIVSRAIALVAAGLILGYAGYWAGTRRKFWRDLRDRATPPADSTDLDVQARIYAKRQNLLRALATDGDLLAKDQIAVRHLMTQQVLTVSPETSVKELKALMAANRVHHLLVCEKGDRLVGVVSDRDIHARRGKTARHVMTPEPHSVRPDMLLGPAITCLISRQISCLPVVEDGRLCGVITAVDLTLVTQCLLQLWLRLAHEMQTKPAWTEELAKVAKMVDHDLDCQQARLVELTQTLGNLAACAGEKMCHLVSAQIEEILAGTKRLTGLIAKTYAVLREQCREGATIVDSRTDPLTGLSSRLGLEEILETMVAMKARHGQPFSMVLAAIERYPEPGGELEPHTLQEVAEWVVGDVRATDLVARYAPNAFAVVLAHTGPEGAEITCTRIGETLRRNLHNTKEPHAVRLAAVSALDNEPLRDLLARADAMLAGPVPDADADSGVSSEDRAELGSTCEAVLTT